MRPGTVVQVVVVVVGQLIPLVALVRALAFFGYRRRAIQRCSLFFIIIIFNPLRGMVDGGWGLPCECFMYARYCALAYCGDGGGDLFSFSSLCSMIRYVRIAPQICVCGTGKVREHQPGIPMHERAIILS